jgi:hypothetical protein
MPLVLKETRRKENERRGSLNKFYTPQGVNYIPGARFTFGQNGH